jgi:hypothetical protein
MNQHDEIHELKASCSAQLSNVLVMPPGLEIANLQISENCYDSNHTTPLNYMQRGTSTAQSCNSNQNAVYYEQDEERDFELENNFHDLQLNSLSNKDNYPEPDKRHIHGSDAPRRGALALQEGSFQNNWEYETGQSTAQVRNLKQIFILVFYVRCLQYFCPSSSAIGGLL